jgi:hypothetical protein
MRSIGLRSLVTAAALVSTTNAFVAPTPSFTGASLTAKQQQLHMMDPMHMFDSMSSLMLSDQAVPAPGEVSYSKASYYTVLALYLMSFPGLWSQIKRSTTAKIKRKTYIRYVVND